MTPALRIAILSDAESWLSEHLPGLVESLQRDGHAVTWCHRSQDLPSGDICFYLGFTQIVHRRIRQQFSNNLVVHESDLPSGKGWSPMSWQIVEGAAEVTLTLFEAIDRVDSGPIYAQEAIHLNGTELVDEWRALQAQATFRLCLNFVRGYPGSAQSGREQTGDESFYRRRTAEHSRLDPQQSIAAQFNLLRVVDNERYPAFFEHRGRKYILRISKADEGNLDTRDGPHVEQQERLPGSDG